ncbi:Os05g0529600 [Oryza sativa Japonica Group]|uniref:DNA polymerase III gamma chain n=1 Tax=Oryza sativa subsp. japonica TaxID=39947 RepID=Q75K66_ORYSJ|nr:putative DNA polymerase III gamma chain [Oryza sativa Japonica Group]AAU43971.1 putative DNA polymerase III gamma chain [Oryza sativa Japonica Group]BAF18037.1 Os05g0529600 [Oryza sativa Japonica Group]|eukprot:NP_001056123.1 Os05g0529600 [Oryza sativa Japonica Group]
MPAPAATAAAGMGSGGGGGGSGEHHMRGHAHLTNCIHLRHHHAHGLGAGSASSGRRRSPTGSSASASAALMRDLLALQRSRSLRDPSTRRSVDSSSRVAAEPQGVGLGLGDDLHDDSSRPGGALKTLLDQLAENPQPKPSRGPRRRFKGGAGRRAAPASATGGALDRGVDGAAAVSVNSSSQEAVCGNKYLFGVVGGDDDDDDECGVELQRPQASQDSRNVCGIPWNWSRIHHRGKSFLDMAGRSFSCGLSDPKSASAARRSIAATSAGSCGHMDGSRSHPHFPVTARLTSTSSDSDSLPLLVDGVRNGIGGIARSFSGELGIFSNQTSELDSDLASEARSGQRSRGSHRGRHQSLTQKYSPKTFKDMIGQSLVVQALSNAILKRKIGLVYVFYGPHGTGKTSCARVFAKALNCHSPEHPRPCDSCASCIAHNLGKSRSLVEIGPVGNIDLDSIVDILDNVMLSPVPTQHRVFIVDDCNTLPPDTWSVISKVIERAPRRVVFILISPNLDLPHIIVSRCQKFFFPKLKECDIVNTLQWISTSEGLDVDRDALKLIASRSDGSLRDAEMTLDQLSLLGQRISMSLVQELVGLVSDDKLVDLLDLALSADTVNTVKTLRDITETGVEPLALMSQLATIITDILAGTYAFTQERVRRKFFKCPTLSKDDMEKLRQALKTLSEAEKQLRVSNDKMTWLTAALLQLAPDKQYVLPSSSTSASFNQGLLTCPEGDIGRSTAIDHTNIYAGPHGLPRNANLGVDSDNNMAGTRRGKGPAPTVQLMFSSRVNKSKAERSREQVLHAFESVLASAITLEIRYEPKDDARAGHVPAISPYPEDSTSNVALRRSFTRHSSASSRGENLIRRLQKDNVVHGANSNQTRWVQSDPHILTEGEIIEVGPSQVDWHSEPNNSAGVRKENIVLQGREVVNNEHGRQNSIVRGKVSLAHVINKAETCSQQGGDWSLSRVYFVGRLQALLDERVHSIGYLDLPLFESMQLLAFSLKETPYIKAAALQPAYALSQVYPREKR